MNAVNYSLQIFSRNTTFTNVMKIPVLYTRADILNKERGAPKARTRT
jgi:hypothetical protein